MEKRVLVIDDEPTSLAVVKSFLEKEGYSVTTAKEGYTGIHEATEKEFDLVILDINMPQMNGFTFLKQLRSTEKGKKVPVIMLTGSQDKTDFMKALEFGITDYIIKPPIRQDLIDRTKKIFGEKHPKDEWDFSDSVISPDGEISFPIDIKSVSNHDIKIVTDFAIPKGKVLFKISLDIFQSIGIKMPELKVVSSEAGDKGRFITDLQYVNLNEEQEKAILDWIQENRAKSEKSA